jgi:hypothetical protein
MDHSDGADTKLVDEHERVAEERVLVRKIDVLLMPLLTILYGLQSQPKMVGRQGKGEEQERSSRASRARASARFS